MGWPLVAGLYGAMRGRGSVQEHSGGKNTSQKERPAGCGVEACVRMALRVARPDGAGAGWPKGKSPCIGPDAGLFTPP